VHCGRRIRRRRLSSTLPWDSELPRREYVKLPAVLLLREQRTLHLARIFHFGFPAWASIRACTGAGLRCIYVCLGTRMSGAKLICQAKVELGRTGFCLHKAASVKGLRSPRAPPNGGSSITSLHANGVK
jgi:hypothetical protein